jgi:hypothetical protein
MSQLSPQLPHFQIQLLTNYQSCGEAKRFALIAIQVELLNGLLFFLRLEI